jgi:hypothetical protein
MKRRIAGLAGLTLALGLAAPVAASTQQQFSFDNVISNVYSCGVIETTLVHADGVDTFGSAGEWLSTSIHFRYDGTLTDPATGRTIAQKGRQNLTIRDGIVASRGQGVFLRLAGEGVVLHDVGRLVFDPGDGSTISASAKVLPFDDPELLERTDAAVCGMFE